MDIALRPHHHVISDRNGTIDVCIYTDAGIVANTDIYPPKVNTTLDIYIIPDMYQKLATTCSP